MQHICAGMWANTTDSITPASSLYTGMPTHARASLRSMDTPSYTQTKGECYKFAHVSSIVSAGMKGWSLQEGLVEGHYTGVTQGQESPPDFQGPQGSRISPSGSASGRQSCGSEGRALSWILAGGKSPRLGHLGASALHSLHYGSCLCV